MTVKTWSKGGPMVRPTFFPTIAWGKWSLRFLAVSYLFLLIAVPIIVVSYKGFEQGLTVFWESINNRIAYSALKLSLRTSATAAVINTIMGTLTAYVLVKYRFPGKAIFNAFIDLPFALPTLVTGVMLVLLYGPQTIVGGRESRRWPRGSGG